MGVVIPLILIILTSVIIWKSSDGFDKASTYLGRNLSDGVKGATINAISSTMPELLTTFFFLIFLKDAEGFSGGIGTVAGSAVFNAMIIPALSIMVVYFYGISKSVTISKKVIYRDSIALLIAQAALIAIIYNQMLNWIGGLVLVLIYLLYVIYMISNMKSNNIENLYEAVPPNQSKNRLLLFLKLDFYGAFIGDKKINSKNAILLLLTSLFFIGVSCLLLVKSCELIGEENYSFWGFNNLKGLNIPISVIAVIIAAAATSVPDTILSVKDAKKGNYNDAISNALGSNIFDICFALGLPILLYSIFFSPIIMDPSTLDFSLNILIILFVLTIFTFVIFIWGDSLGIKAAILLISMYIFFILFLLFNYV